MEQENLPDEGHQSTTASRPAAKFTGSGGLQVAVWKERDEGGRDRYSVKADRSYKQADGNYNSTSYIRDGDVLRLSKLLGEADSWIELDKAKGPRAQNAAAAGR